MSCRAIAAVALLLALGATGCKAARPAVAPTSTAQRATPARTPQPTVSTPNPSPTRLPVPSTTVVARVGTPGLVTIAASRFTPDSITVAAGRPVTFQNDDAVARRVVSDESGLFDTGQIAPGASAQVTISAQGFHDFHDAANPALNGTIRILP